jgi:hypothetical protein
MLKRNKHVAKAYGFKQITPSHGVFTHFRNRLTKDWIQKNLFNSTKEAHEK